MLQQIFFKLFLREFDSFGTYLSTEDKIRLECGFLDPFMCGYQALPAHKTGWLKTQSFKPKERDDDECKSHSYI